MSVVAAYHAFVSALFLVQGGMWTAAECYFEECHLFILQFIVYIPLCTGNNINVNTLYAATTLIIMEYS